MANKIVRIAPAGGLLGALGTNPGKAIESELKKHNAAGWRCQQIIPLSANNLFIEILQLAILFCTVGFWTFGAGYLLLLELEEGRELEE